jgi:CRISP-associated protein Cas1
MLTVFVENEDTLDFKGRILEMTPDERKRLGINKSTLWHMKKNIRDGKKIKFYDRTLSKMNI